MERHHLWWDLAGPSKFVGRVVKAVAQSQRVICVAASNPRPAGLADAIDRRLKADLSFDCVRLDLAGKDQSQPTPHLLAELLDVPLVEIGAVADFASHPNLSDLVILVDGVDRRHLRRWSLFLRHLTSEGGGDAVVGPVIILFLPVGLTKDEMLELTGPAKIVSAQGIIDRYDSVGYIAGIGIRPGDDLAGRVGHAVVLDVAAWSRECLETMSVWETSDQIEPFALLERAADKVSIPYPCWENGLVDLWDDEPVAHPIASVKHGLHDHLRRRIWSAQASVLLPFTYRILRSIISRYRDVIERRVSPENPLRKDYNGREILIVDPWKLEFYDVREFTKHVMSRSEFDLVKSAGAVRNAMAHRDLVDSRQLSEFSEHYEANRDALECDVPGWNWPRCGQVMTLTVGPSGAGKSTWSAAQGTEIVSSDAVRMEIAPNGEISGDQSEIFRRVRARSSSLLANGRDVIVDAMHIEEKARLRQVSVAPPDVAVRYAVIDRPLSEKQRDAGWRTYKGIVERYDQLFADQLDMVLSGDGNHRIKVEDIRKMAATDEPPGPVTES
jgi:predicted kinase